MSDNADQFLTDDDILPLGTFPAAGTVASLTQTGLPLAAGLEACCEEMASYRDRQALRTLSRHVAEGVPLDEALTRSRVVPPYLRGLLAAGMQSGQLPRLLGEYLSLHRQLRGNRQMIWLTCAYPLFIVLAMLGIGLLLPMYIVPQMKQMFVSFGMELPHATQVLVNLSDLMVTYPWLIGGMILFPVVILLGHNRMPGVGVRQWLLGWIPFLGESARLLSQSELCTQLALLVRGRMPLPEAFQVLKKSLTSRRLRRSCGILADHLESGCSPDSLSDRHSDVPFDVLHLLGRTDHPEAMADQLLLAAKGFAVQSQVKLRQGLVLFEPLFLVFFAFCFLFVVFALFSPLVHLLSGLS